MAAAADADALDALLSIQLKLVEQQIRGSLAQPKVAPALAVNSVVRDDGLARTVAAKQTRLRALDAQNAALERELAASAAALRRGPGGSHVRQHDRAMPRPSSDDVELREMLRESVQMHRELMQDVRAETEGRRQQRQRWDEEDGDGEDSDTDTGWPKELDDVLNANADPYGSFGGTLAAHPPPMQAGPQPSAEQGVGGANGEPGWGKAKGKGAASELQEELLSEIDHALEENAVSSDSDAPSEEPLARRGSTDPGGPSQDDPLVSPRTAGSRPRTRGSSVVTGEEEEEEEPPPSDEDVRLALESLYESAGGWLKRAMRPIVSSIVRDPTLKLDVWGNEAIGGGLLGRVLGSRPGVPKPAEEEKACSKIRIRAKSILEVITEAIPDAPGTMLGHLHFLTTRRFKWPENTLLPSVQATQDIREDGTATPTHRSPVAVVLQLLAVRLVCEELLLRPKENQLAGKLTSAAQSNLKMVAAFLFTLFEMCVARTDDHTRMSELIAVEQQAIGQALTQYYNNPLRFQPQLGRLCTFGLPQLRGWLREALAALENVAKLLLQAAQERESNQAVGAVKDQQK